MIIMGIDPGLASTGVGVIESYGEGSWRSLYFCHVITATALSLPHRLDKIHGLVQSTIATYRPQAVSIESIFFAKNVRSAVMMAHGRGAAILAAAHSGVSPQEYSPLEIKQSVVGKGRASKEQVKRMVGILLGMEEPPESDHAADALACALCHAYRSSSALARTVSIAEANRPVAEVAAYKARKEMLSLSLRRGSGRRRR